MRQTIRNVFPLWEQLYDLNPSGGPAHCVTDDGNLEDTAIDFCIQWCDEAVEKGYCDTEEADAARRLLTAMRQFCYETRLKMYQMYWEMGRFGNDSTGS